MTGVYMVDKQVEKKLSNEDKEFLRAAYRHSLPGFVQQMLIQEAIASVRLDCESEIGTFSVDGPTE